ncbi:MAG: type II toxin-antitoxin system RelE/ParE family toxin [Bacteroidota bacterium]
MEIKVLWSDLALNQLEEIFDYFKFKANIKVAKKIVSKIVDRTIQLENNPQIGTNEPLLKNRDKNYRFLVEGNYKIIYFKKDNYINISSVFDGRQNPKKLKETLI